MNIKTSCVGIQVIFDKQGYNMFEESDPDYIYIQELVDDKSILKISEYAVKYKLSIQELIYNTKGLSNDLWRDVSDTMLGILYDKFKEI